MAKDQFQGEIKCVTCEKSQIYVKHVFINKPGEERPILFFVQSISCLNCVKDLWNAKEANIPALVNVVMSHGVEL